MNGEPATDLTGRLPVQGSQLNFVPMKKAFILFISLFGALNASAQEVPVSKIILVRHAEKASDDPRDPSLSEKGKQRAVLLAALLKDVPVDAFYATPYKRTTQTIAVLAEANGHKIQNYKPMDKANLAEIVQAGKGKTIVIAGHSNTVPPMVNALIGKEEYPLMDDNDYGKIWILVFKGDKLVDRTVLNY